VDVENAPSRLRALPTWLVAQAAIRGQRIVAEVLTEQDSHRSEYALLAGLDEFGPQSQTELSERSGLDRSDIVRWVDDLVARKLARRSQDPQDRRRNVITLTALGRRRLGTLDRAVGTAQQRLTKGLSAAERQQLVALLGRLIEGTDHAP
jgi:MarR family transcriptional regulator, lower aerobic nicotinate degradation pathway regulator